MEKKFVLKVQNRGSKWCFSFGFMLGKLKKKETFQTKVLKKIAGTSADVQSLGLEGDAGDKFVVTGKCIDAVELVNRLKKIGQTSILSLEPVKEKTEEVKGEHPIPIGCTTYPYYGWTTYPYYVCCRHP